MAFLGKNFHWFIGVVEDRFDPLKVGRLRVRCLGIHTGDKLTLPTIDLPWASVMLPTTSAGISGLGQSPSFIVEGAWVWGYFRDGSGLMQEMVIVGTLPGRPAELGKTASGFYDPNSRLDENGEPTGVSVYPKELEVDTNRLAVNLKDDDGNEINPHLALELRRATRITGLATADFDATKAADNSDIVASDTDTWDQPEIAYATIYPSNHVYESESGHILEFDDTSAAERIHLQHKTGSSFEYNPNGDRVQIIKGIDYKLTSSHNLVNIEGRSDISIGGRHKIYINKDGQTNNHYDIQVGPNASVNIQVDKGDMNVVLKDGKLNTNVAGDYNMKIGGNMNLDVRGNKIETVSGSKTSNTTGAVIHSCLLYTSDAADE